MPPRIEEPSNLIEKAMKVNVNEFLDLTGTVVDMMSKEINHIGNLK